MDIDYLSEKIMPTFTERKLVNDFSDILLVKVFCEIFLQNILKQVYHACMQKLSNEQRLHLELLVKKTRDVNERNRVCVILGRDDGHSPS